MHKIAGKQHSFKKKDAAVQRKEAQLDELAHFNQNKHVYSIVDSALKGDIEDKAAVVSFLVHLYQKLTPKFNICNIIKKSSEITEHSKKIKVQFDGLVEFILP